MKIRTSRLRVEQRKLFEEYGWAMPGGVAGNSAKKSNKKRDAEVLNGDAEPVTPTKKPRTKKGKTVEMDEELQTPTSAASKKDVIVKEEVEEVEDLED